MLSSEIRFNAPWSIQLGLITAFTILLFLSFPIIILIESESQVLQPVTLILLTEFVFFLWIFRTQFIRGYFLSYDKLIINRFGANTEFRLDRLQSVEHDLTAMNWIYAMVNGGLFAFAGKMCRNKNLGTFEAYATDKKRSVVLRFPKHILVVTPDNPAAFVQAIKKRVK